MKTLPHTQLTPYWRATFFYTNSFRLSGGKRGVLYYIIYRLRNCFLSLLSEMPRCFLFLFLPRDRFTNSESLNFLLVFIQTIFFTGFTFLRSANGPCKCWLLHERKGKKNHTNNRKKKKMCLALSRTEKGKKRKTSIYTVYIYIPHVEPSGGMNGESLIIHITPNYISAFGLRRMMGEKCRAKPRLCAVSRRVK